MTPAARTDAARQISRATDADAFALSEAADPVTRELARRDCHRRAEEYALYRQLRGAARPACGHA